MKKIIMLITLALLTACSVVDEKLNLNYDVSVGEKGGKGDVFLAKTKDLTNKQIAQIGIVLGSIRNKSGDKSAHIISTSNLSEWVDSAMSLELSNAGYKVGKTDIMPKDAKKGVEVTITKMSVSKVLGFFTDDVKINMAMKVALTKNGDVVKYLNAVADGDSSLKNGNKEEFEKAMQSALQTAMKQIMTEIIASFEK